MFFMASCISHGLILLLLLLHHAPLLPLECPLALSFSSSLTLCSSSIKPCMRSLVRPCGEPPRSRPPPCSRRTSSNMPVRSFLNSRLPPSLLSIGVSAKPQPQPLPV